MERELLIVLDGNMPWVRSLFAAMPNRVRVALMRPIPASLLMRAPRAALTQWKAAQSTGCSVEYPFLLPGWKHGKYWSAQIAANQIRRAADSYHGRATVIYTLPQYSIVAAELTEFPSAYFAFDPYENYGGWDPKSIRKCEDDLFGYCSCAFAISRKLRDDFRSRTDIPLFVQPNGIAANRIGVQADGERRPSDLPVGAPIALCVGQIGTAYDWELLDDVTEMLREVHFVFVGPCLRMPREVQLRVDRVFQKKNVTALGWRNPNELSAYMASADVLFSPLCVTAANDRRSLLRMYDYLAAERPIVATPIDSSLEHGDFMGFASTAKEYANAISIAIAGGCDPVELRKRREYLSEHTWERRAEQFLENLRLASVARREIHDVA